MSTCALAISVLAITDIFAAGSYICTGNYWYFCSRFQSLCRIFTIWICFL